MFGPDVEQYIRAVEAARKVDAARAKEIEEARATLATTKSSDGVKHYRPGLLDSLEDLLLAVLHGKFPSNYY